jgi:hypothetical protein
MFASSGGAVTALALVAAYPNDVTTGSRDDPLLSDRFWAISVLRGRRPYKAPLFEGSLSEVVSLMHNLAAALTANLADSSSAQVSMP